MSDAMPTILTKQQLHGARPTKPDEPEKFIENGRHCRQELPQGAHVGLALIHEGVRLPKLPILNMRWLNTVCLAASRSREWSERRRGARRVSQRAPLRRSFHSRLRVAAKHQPPSCSGICTTLSKPVPN